MFLNRRYAVGDTVFFLAKGGPNPGSALRVLPGVNRDEFRGAALAAEPIILAEGIVASVMDPRGDHGDDGGDLPPIPQQRAGEALTVHTPAARGISVWFTAREDNPERVLSTAAAVNFLFSEQSLVNSMARVDRAVNHQLVREEQYNFAKRFVLPEVVVDRGVNRLLLDIREAAGIQGPIGFADRADVIAEARRLGFHVRLSAPRRLSTAHIPPTNVRLENWINQMTFRGAGGIELPPPEAEVEVAIAENNGEQF